MTVCSVIRSLKFTITHSDNKTLNKFVFRSRNYRMWCTFCGVVKLLQDSWPLVSLVIFFVEIWKPFRKSFHGFSIRWYVAYFWNALFHFATFFPSHSFACRSLKMPDYNIDEQLFWDLKIPFSSVFFSLQFRYQNKCCRFCVRSEIDWVIFETSFYQNRSQSCPSLAKFGIEILIAQLFQMVTITANNTHKFNCPL